MTQKLWWLICFALVPSPASAQEWEERPVPGVKSALKCNKQDPSKCAILLLPGEKAPLLGILQSPTQAAAVAAKADPELIERRIKLEVRTATMAVANDKDLEIAELRADNKRLTDTLGVTEKNYEKRVEAVTPHWTSSPWFVIPVTVATTLGVVGASVAIGCKLNGNCGGNN